MDRKKEIKEHWEDPHTISMKDANLHEMETWSIARHIKASDIVIDIGCGDGLSTKTYAERAYEVAAIEYTKTLFNKAKKNLHELKNVEVYNKDFFDFNIRDYNIKPTIVVSQRFLINLETTEAQESAIKKIFDFLPSQGLFIMAENFSDSFEKMNRIREHFGLVKIQRHWHNLYFNEIKTRKLLEQYGEIESIESFDTYILLTRVFYEMMYPGKKPDVCFDYKSRRFSEIFKDDDQIGPNQTWVVRKR